MSMYNERATSTIQEQALNFDASNLNAYHEQMEDVHFNENYVRETTP